MDDVLKEIFEHFDSSDSCYVSQNYQKRPKMTHYFDILVF